MWAHYQEDARRAILFAQEEALKVGNTFVDENCLLLGCLATRDETGILLLTSLGIDLGEIQTEAVQRAVASRKSGKNKELLLSDEAKRATDAAAGAWHVLGGAGIGVGHLMVGLASIRGSILARRLAKRRERSSDLLVRLRIQNEVLRTQAARYGADRLSELYHSFRPLDLLTFSTIVELRYGVEPEEVAVLDRVAEEIEKVGMNAKNTSTTSELAETIAEAAGIAVRRGEDVHAAHLLAALYQRSGTTLSQVGPGFYPTHEEMLDRLVPKQT